MLDSLKSLLNTDRSSAKDSDRLILVRRDDPKEARQLQACSTRPRLGLIEARLMLIESSGPRAVMFIVTLDISRCLRPSSVLSFYAIAGIVSITV